MRIGLLTTSFPRRQDDVPGHFVLGFAQALAACGHQLSVLAPEPAGPEWQTPPSFPGIAVHWVRYLRPRALERTFYGAGVLDNLRREPWTAIGLLPFMVALWAEAAERAHSFDALVSHWALPCALVAGALRPRVPHLAVLHSADVFVLERLPLRRALALRIANRSDALLFSSRELRTRFLALLEPLSRAEVAPRCHVCAMGIEPCTAPHEPRAALRARLGLTKLTLLSLGRLIALKGIEHAIDAVSGRDDVELIIAGEGPVSAALRRRAREARAPVRFLGEVHGAEKSAWLTAADIFVLPSIVLASGRSEGMPTTLLEAMDHGLPVIASDVGGVRDVVRAGENGVLVPHGNAAAIAHAIDALRDEALRARLSQDARATASMYHWSELGPRLCELLFAADVRQDSC